MRGWEAQLWEILIFSQISYFMFITASSVCIRKQGLLMEDLFRYPWTNEAAKLLIQNMETDPSHLVPFCIMLFKG